MKKEIPFIKFLKSDTTLWILESHPNAFLLLTQIALRARRYDGHPDGMLCGECYIGDHKKCGLTRQKYRTALTFLKKRKIIEEIVNSRDRQKSTTGSTTVGTKVKLLKSDVYDVNSEDTNHCINHCPTTVQPQTRKNKKEKEENTNHSARGQTEKKPLVPRCGGGIFFCRIDGKFNEITGEWMNSMRETYPGVDIEQQLREMRNWLMTDKKGLTYKGNQQFIKSWLSRSASRSPNVSKNTQESFQDTPDSDLDQTVLKLLEKRRST